MSHLEHGDSVPTIVLRGTVGNAKACRAVESEGRSARTMVVRHWGARCLQRIIIDVEGGGGWGLAANECRYGSVSHELLVGKKGDSLHNVSTT